MKKLFLVGIAFVLLLGGIAYTHAESTANQGPDDRAQELRKATEDALQQFQQQREQLQEELQKQKEDAKESLQQQREQVREEVEQNASGTSEQIREGLKQQLEQRTEALKQAFEQQREEFKNQLELRKEDVKGEFEQNRQELQQRLQVIKDERKKEIVTRLFGNIDELNKRITENFSQALDTMSDALTRIVSRTQIAQSNGYDTTSVEAAIGTATTAIDTARTAVLEQASKVYAIDVTTEDMLKSDVITTRDQLRTDLQAAREKLIAARDALQKVLEALGQIPNVDDLENASSSL